MEAEPLENVRVSKNTASLRYPKGTTDIPTSHTPFRDTPFPCFPSCFPCSATPQHWSQSGAGSQCQSGGGPPQGTRQGEQLHGRHPAMPSGTSWPLSRGPCHIQGSPAYSQQCRSSLLLLLVLRPPGAPEATGSKCPLMSHRTPGAGLCWEGSRECQWRAQTEPNCLVLPSLTTAGVRVAAWACTPVSALAPWPCPHSQRSC